MMFQFFKPKWQHSNPKVRRQAYEALDPARSDHRALLLDQLRTDPDPVLRQWLLTRVGDYDTLRAIAADDADAMVREAAQQRCRRLLAGNDDGLSIDDRIRHIDALNDDAALLHIVRNGTEASVRQRAMERLARESVYADVATDDSDGELRLAAAQCLSTPAVMERVLKAAKNKDKRVRALLQQRLDERAAAIERPRQCYREMKQLCIKLEAEHAWLTTHGDDERVRDRADRLRQTWRDTESTWRSAQIEDDERLVARFGRADAELTKELATRAAIAARARDEQAARDETANRARAICEGLQRVVETARAWVDPDVSELDRLTADDNAASGQWSALDAALIDSDLSQAFAALRNEIERIRSLVPAHARARQRLVTLIDEVRGAIDAGGALDANQVQRWFDGRQRVESELHFALRDEVASECGRLFDRLSERAGRQEQRQRASFERFKKGVPELAQLVDDGQIKAAQSLSQSLQDTLRNLPDADRVKAQRTGAYRQFQALNKRLGELRDWKSWAAAPIQEQLRDEAVALADDIARHAGDVDFDFAGAAKQVQRLRKRWQQLGSSDGNTASEIWPQFDEACNRAYAPCQASFDRLAQQREEHAQSKTRLCEELEKFYAEHVADKDPGEVDWRAVAAAVREAYKSWDAVGPADRKEQASLAQRFRAAVERLKQAGGEERDRNAANKEALVKRAEQLAAQLGERPESATLADAINVMKGIQRDWQNIGAATKEKALWDRLRLAADKVFAQRQAEFEFQEQAQRADAAERERLCGLVMQLAQLEGAELRAARVQVAHIRDQWQALAKLPRDKAKAWDRRWRDACNTFDEALAQWDRIQAEAARTIVAEQGRLCDAVEAALESAVRNGDDDAILRATVNDQRKAWAFLLDSVEASALALDERWAAVHEEVDGWLHADSARRSDLAATLLAKWASNAEAKSGVVLRAELVTGLDSPPELADDRRALQLSMLADKLSGKGRPPVLSPTDMTVEWHALGYAGATQDPSLQQRFARVTAVLMKAA